MIHGDLIKFAKPYSTIDWLEIRGNKQIKVKEFFKNFSKDLGLHTSTLPSGVYFCTLQTPECTITKKFVVVR